MIRPTLGTIFHPDPRRLEEELSRIIQEIQGDRDGIPSILVVAPSRRLVQHLREALASRVAALIGVEVLHYQSLAYRIVSNAAEGASPASPALVEALTSRIIADSNLELAAYARDRRTAAGTLTRLFEELRESGVTPDDLTAAGTGGEVTELYRRFDAAIREHPERLDRPGLIECAIRIAPDLPPVDAVLSYGAYDLVGVHLKLIQSIPATRDPGFLVLADPNAPTGTFARQFAERHFPEPITTLADTSPQPFVSVSRSFRQRNGDSPVALPEDRIALAHAQGPESELTVAVRRALSLVQQGVLPHDIGILARTLAPYSQIAETVFERNGLRVDTSLQLPLSRFPLPKTLGLLLHALGRDFQRQAVIELVRSSHFDNSPVNGDSETWWPGSWDQWSRSYGIIGGSRSWKELPNTIRNQDPPPYVGPGADEQARFRERAARDAASAEQLARVIELWEQDVARWHECHTGVEHAEFVRYLAGRWIRRWNEPGGDPGWRATRRSLDQVIGDIEGLDWVGRATTQEGDPPGLTPEDVFLFVQRGLETATLASDEPGGVRFLDLMQARGLSFKHLFLVGFNEHVMPRHPRENPFLHDAVRMDLRTQSGKPIGISREGQEEEWLLFAQTIASATDSLTVTWQRANAEGKAISPSLYLRELARHLPESPSLRQVLEHKSLPVPERIPTHPGDAARWMRKDTKMLSREEAALVASEHGADSVSGIENFLQKVEPGLSEHLAPGLTMVRETELFLGGDLRYDGTIPGGTGWNRPFSQSSLKAMARCPQTFFFSYILGVRPLDDAAKEFRLEARELGSHMHKILELVFRDLDREEMLGETADGTKSVEAALRSLERHWEPVLKPVKERIHERFPVLYEHAEGFWKQEITDFLKRDVDRLAKAGHRVKFLEEAWQTTISLSETALERLRRDDGLMVPAQVDVLGIPDRVTIDRDGRWQISDYKTGGKLEKEVEPKNYLIGQRIQLPLYTLMAEMEGAAGGTSAELLGLGPVFAPVGGVEPMREVVLDPVEFQTRRAGFEETMAILATGATLGRFPFREGFHCRWCEFAAACRRYHFPSRERVKEEPTYKNYFLAQKKTKTKDMLEDVDDED